MHTNCVFMHTHYIYTDASICLTRNHQELPSYPKAAQPDASTREPQKAPSQLCCRGVSLGHPGPKKHVAVDFRFLQQGQQLAFVLHLTNGPRKIPL